ncbi:hypothetical protein C8K30_101215 [Promicromonospora sp. AC04]|uniref:ABC transporter permease n=1 Tax=Promicromonospora sp. AC04 TaxID=2135723 RepID=UPI000D4BBA76|nr:ABC transporter permease [Promicromonospora sp. AC04]PUB31699.1 hypothetical protein C8K30_101215 [Promicromonospora sp. AC04]
MSQDAPAPHTPAGRVIGIAVALTLVLTVFVLAFSWPAVTSEPKDLPVAVVGSDNAVATLRDTLTEQQPGAVDLIEVDDRDAAVEAIETREVYGGIVLGDVAAGEAPEILTASAASGVTHQLMTQLGAQMQQGIQAQADAAIAEALASAQAQAAEAVRTAVQEALEAAAQGEQPQAPPSGEAEAPEIPEVPQVTVTDVVPLSADDPRGTGFTAALFPLLLGGMIGGIGISIAVSGALRRVLAVTVYSVVGGALLVGILHFWFGSLQGDWLLEAGALILAIAAIAAPITGFVAVLGRPGIALGPVIMMLVGNPISGAAMPTEFLPWHWGAIGQWLPPGASATLLRDVSYFPDADASQAWLALAVWTAAGVLLSLVGHARATGSARRAAVLPDPA